MRKKIIAGNWKMNTTYEEAIALVNDIAIQENQLHLSENKIVVIAPPFPYLAHCSTLLKDKAHFYIAAQNCSEHSKGAYTGEVSAAMLASIQANYIIVGHSERRTYFQETDAVILQKIKQALQQNMTPIFCCGEPLHIRENNTHFEFIQAQLQNCIFHLSDDEIKKIVIAYEPIWAIGTGKTATPQQAQEVHCYIRNEIKNNFGVAISASISILYGGSVNATNAAELFDTNDIDGGLVGGASLNATDFTTIIKAMQA